MQINSRFSGSLLSRAAALLTAAAILIFALPYISADASAVGSVIYDKDSKLGYTIDVSADGKFTATICEFIPDNKLDSVYDIKIPDTISAVKYPVTAIASSAFSSFVSRANIRSVSIPNSVQTIGDYAFSDCTGLEKADLSNSLTKLGTMAFAGCVSLKEIKTPDTLKEIGYAAFSGCSAVQKLTLSKGLTYIGQSAFSGCTGLKTVEIPDNVVNIGSSAFEGCTGINSLKLSKALTAIDAYVFHNCSSLITVEIPDSVKSIGNNAFAGCVSLASINVPNSVESIGNSAFSGCSSLGAVILPPNLENISDGAFYGAPVTIWGYSNSYAESYAHRNNLNFQSSGSVYTVTFSADNYNATVNNIAIRSSKNTLVIPPSSVTKGEQLTINVTAPQGFDVNYITINDAPFANGSTFTVAESDVNIFVSYKAKEQTTTTTSAPVTAAPTSSAATSATTAAQVTTVQQTASSSQTTAPVPSSTPSSAETTSPADDGSISDSYIKVDSDLEDINGEKVRIVSKRENFIGPATVRITNTAEAYEAASSASESLDIDNAMYYAFDISLLDQNGRENQGILARGTITFQMPVPNELLPYADKIRVYHIVDETPELIRSSIIEDISGVKRVQFESDSFSPYMLIAETEEELVPVINEEEPGDDASLLPDDSDDTTSVAVIEDGDDNTGSGSGSVTPDAQVVNDKPSSGNTPASTVNYNGNINPHTGAIVAGTTISGLALICIPLVRSRKKRKRAKSR